MKQNRKTLIAYILALFSAAALFIAISYLNNMRVDLESELAVVKAQLEIANRKYEDLLLERGQE